MLEEAISTDKGWYRCGGKEVFRILEGGDQYKGIYQAEQTQCHQVENSYIYPYKERATKGPEVKQDVRVPEITGKHEVLKGMVQEVCYYRMPAKKALGQG